MKTLIALAIAFPLLAAVSHGETPALLKIPVKDIDGKSTSLSAFSGKVLLVVNVASQCGYTRQYAGLEALYQKYHDKGLVVLGFPANDFGAQEPGTDAEIKQFCSSKFDVTFPMFSKIHVKGPEQHPLFQAMTGSSSAFPGDIKWNFGKFLIAKDGQLLARFGSDTEPNSENLVSQIEKALTTK